MILSEKSYKFIKMTI